MEALETHAIDRERRAITRALRGVLFASLLAAVVLLVLLAGASGNTNLFERNYPLLLWLTIGVAALLAVLAFDLLRRLLVRLRRGLFGTRLMARMAGAFVLMSVLPLALVFFVAVQFVGRSIESWFDVPLERALDSGMNLARVSLEGQLSELTRRARSMSVELADSGLATQALLSRLCEPVSGQECTVMTGGGRVLASSGGQISRLLPDLPAAETLRQARLMRQVARVEGGEPGSGKGLKLRVIVLMLAGQRPDDSQFLQLVQPVSSLLSENAEAVQQGYRDFQELSLSRAGLKRIFNVTLTLTFLLTMFSAVAGAFLLAGWLTGPLSELAAATRSVTEGQFRRVKDYGGRDELGVLTRSFNDMTQQLEEARSLADRNQRELERVNARLESVLANLDAGVMVLDAELRLTLANPGADRIVGASLEGYLGAPLASLPRVGALAEAVRSAFNEHAAAGATSWQRQFILPRDAGPEDAAASTPDPWRSQATGQTLLARGSILAERRVGYVIVFDDVSDVISAQRANAWAEVARRLAHEIKNPLTPIQLAAERVQFKLHDRLAPADAALLDKNARTIINQVSALKTMVDEFRDYARLPSTRLEPLDLNALVDDVVSLWGDDDSLSQIHLHLAADLPLLQGDVTQIRQVIHNLVKNALEASERSSAPSVDVSTLRAELADGESAVRMVVRDNGSGFTPTLLAHAFEPYVTSKPRGTGLGLAIVRKIVEEHGAHIELGNWSFDDGRIGGAQVSILFTKLAKNRDNPPNEA